MTVAEEQAAAFTDDPDKQVEIKIILQEFLDEGTDFTPYWRKIQRILDDIRRSSS